jgi:hypothetical protein
VEPARIAALAVVGIMLVGIRSVAQVNIDLYNKWLGTSFGKRAEDRLVVFGRLVGVATAIIILVM